MSMNRIFRAVSLGVAPSAPDRPFDEDGVEALLNEARSRFSKKLAVSVLLRLRSGLMS